MLFLLDLRKHPRKHFWKKRLTQTEVYFLYNATSQKKEYFKKLESLVLSKIIKKDNESRHKNNIKQTKSQSFRPTYVYLNLRRANFLLFLLLPACVGMVFCSETCHVQIYHAMCSVIYCK